MQPRYPKIDYSKVRADWAPIREFAHRFNSASSIPVVVEPYLIKVMRKVKEKLDPKYVQLHNDIDVFNKQEGQHYQQHGMFNAMLVKAGFPKILEFEKDMKDQYVDWIKNKSLKFNLAYCEGFESLSAPSVYMWFEEDNKYLQGCDAPALDMWRWHLAEEFEHREVCFQSFKALYGRGFINSIVNGYFYRVWAFFYAMNHLKAFQQKVLDYMFEVDRAAMTPEQVAASKARHAAATKDYEARMKGVLLTLLPFYNPGRKRPPPGMDKFIKRLEPGGDIAQPAALPEPVPA
jgi:uncharacterized protein